MIIRPAIYFIALILSPSNGVFQEFVDVSLPHVMGIGMISHKMPLITIFGHKHFMQKFHQKFDIFHEKISTASDFGSYLVSNCKF